MNILFVTSEAVPFSKTGGLADVAGSLPQALAANGDEVSVVLPLYAPTAQKFGGELEFVRYYYVRLAWRNLYCGVFTLKRDGVTFYFIDNEYYFKRENFYGYFDDGERFAFFSRAVVDLLEKLPQKPQVVHCNDWQSGLVPVYIRDESARNEFYRDIRTVITVHNIEYQGRCGWDAPGELLGLDPGWMHSGTLEYGGDVNILKGAMLVADAVTAVSPTYAQQLRSAEYAHGLENVIELCADKLHGVLNGIDMVRYNPSKDTTIAKKYSLKKPEGKAVCKAHLQEKMGLNVDAERPIIAMVSRLVMHKGLDLVCAMLDELMASTDAQFAILGKGDAQYEEFFAGAQARWPGRVAFYMGYSEELSLEIYSGADLFLMPSKSEPCGLSQLIAMRYGTVPIVRETGGLRDTVHAYEAQSGKGNGFSFAAYNAHDMAYVVREAVALYHDDPEAFKKIRNRGMMQDFSWKASAVKYHEIYEKICNS